VTEWFNAMQPGTFWVVDAFRRSARGPARFSVGIPCRVAEREDGLVAIEREDDFRDVSRAWLECCRTIVQTDRLGQIIRPWKLDARDAWALPRQGQSVRFDGGFYTCLGGLRFDTGAGGHGATHVTDEELAASIYVRRCPECRKNTCSSMAEACGPCGAKPGSGVLKLSKPKRPREKLLDKDRARLARLIAGAAEAEDRIPIDELEAHAAERAAEQETLGHALARSSLAPPISGRAKAVARYNAKEASGAPPELHSEAPMLLRPEVTPPESPSADALHEVRCPKCGTTCKGIAVFTQGVAMTRLYKGGTGVVRGDDKDGHLPTYSEDATESVRRLLGLEEPDAQTAVASCDRCLHSWVLPAWAWEAIWR
jgi:hypothetical protein